MLTDTPSRRIHFHPALLARIEAAADADRRTFANFVAATLEHALDYWELGKLAPPPAGVKLQAMRVGLSASTGTLSGGIADSSTTFALP